MSKPNGLLIFSLFYVLFIVDYWQLIEGDFLRRNIAPIFADLIFAKSNKIIASSGAITFVLQLTGFAIFRKIDLK